MNNCWALSPPHPRGASYPREVQEREESAGAPTQPPAPDSSAAGRVDQCPALGPSLPICKMRGSDDISASSETPRWALTPLGLHAYLKACALAQHLGQDMRPLAHSSCVISS